jgi:hypothetical protein
MRVSESVRVGRISAAGACLFILAGGLSGQVMMRGFGSDGVVRIHNTDLAIFEAKEPRRDLPCAVSPNRPILGFDLRFHATYEVAIPLRELAGKENLLTILFRVRSEARPNEPLYFMQRVRVPEIEEQARGDAYLHGGFDVGEGSYQVEWLMRDRAERVCSAFWDVKAVLPERDREIELRVAADQISEPEFEQFKEEPPVVRSSGGDSLSVKILINFAPQNSRAATLQPFDTSALVAILRTIAREPRIGKFSVVAFNLHEQRIIHRQDGVSRIDFPALGASLESLNLGTVDLKRLSEEHGDTRFLADLIQQEFGAEPAPDALIFAGPKVLLEKNVSEEQLAVLRDVPYPVFYMNYNLYPRENPWRDAIGNAVRFFKGAEFTISRPRDLWFAVSEVVSQIAKLKRDRLLGATSTE